MLLRPLLHLLSMSGVPRLVWSLFMDKRVPLPVKAILPAAIAYLILPFDLLPDIVTPIGRIDDLLVLVIGTLAFLTLAPKHVVSEHLRRGKRTAAAGSENDGEVVDGRYRYVDDPAEDDDPKQPRQK